MHKYVSQTYVWNTIQDRQTRQTDKTATAMSQSNQSSDACAATTTTNPPASQAQQVSLALATGAIHQQNRSLLVAKILAMCLQNGVALALRQPRPFAIVLVNVLRSRLLRDPFFDEEHRPEELTVRTRPSRILFMDITVLLARLMRVLMRQNPLDEEATRERIAVRNECLDQPFFQRERVNSLRPFTDDDFEDEAAVV